MSRELLEQALDALEQCTYDEEGYLLNPDNEEVIEALRAELAKPEPEPVAYWIPKADQFCVAKTDRPFAKAWEPLYAAPTEPNCRFPICHSQEYQDKLVQEILEDLNDDPAENIRGMA